MSLQPERFIIYLPIMFLSNLIKSTSTGITLLSFIGGAIAFTNPAMAFGISFDNEGLEDPVNLSDGSGWEGTGDVFIDNNSSNFTQVNPVEGNSQAVITTGRNSEIDDPNTAASTFNFSDVNDPVTATSDDGADALQDALGLPTNALSIPRSGSADDTRFRTAKEGSGFYQDFTITVDPDDIALGNNIFAVDFNWSYLSNDGVVDSRFGEQDFSFFTIYDTSSSTSDRSINILDSSGGNVNVPHSDGSNFQDVNIANYDTDNVFSYISDPITTPGTYTYRLGFGVVDVDGTDRTSALLVDNLNVRNIPFDFSSTGGIGVMFALMGFNYCQRKIKLRGKKSF